MLDGSISRTKVNAAVKTLIWLSPGVRLNHNILTALGSSLRASIIKINATPEKT
jgi:hypothetical protein